MITKDEGSEHSDLLSRPRLCRVLATSREGGRGLGCRISDLGLRVQGGIIENKMETTIL